MSDEQKFASSGNTAGDRGQAKAIGPYSDADASGGKVRANGGDAWSSNRSEVEQSNQIAGRDNKNDYEGESYAGGANFSAACNGFGSTKTCDQSNGGAVTQSSTATGGNGGSNNTAGWGGQSFFGSDASGGSVWANGGDAWLWSWLYVLQSNQIAGNDNTNG
jgi:hypothetical protein